jgi:hypothetical protein
LQTRVITAKVQDEHRFFFAAGEIRHNDWANPPVGSGGHMPVENDVEHGAIDAAPAHPPAGSV